MTGVLLGGCTASPKRPPGPDSLPPHPFGIPDAPIPPRLTPGTGTSVTKGLLAGQVIDKFDRKVPKASIQLVEMHDSGPAGAPLEVWANEQGYFTIPGLDPSQTYQLTARIGEGSKVVMAATVFARPPDPRVLIKISEDYVSPVTPAPPALPAVGVPSKPKEPEEKKDPKPAASLERPTPSKPDTPPPAPVGDRGSSEVPVPDAGPVRVPRPDLKIEVPRLRPPPPLILPPTPPRVNAVVPEDTSPYSSDRLPVPSCIMLASRQIDNFALSQLDGQSWEFRRNHKGRLILIDFWHTRCQPCLNGIGHLNELHQAYGARGLEVIGVACETGPVEERVQRILSVRGRHDIRYRVLLSGDQGPLKPCPLCTQLGVGAYPTLKLLNERGEIVWESVGLGERQLYELKREIERRLPLTR